MLSLASSDVRTVVFVVYNKHIEGAVMSLLLVDVMMLLLSLFFLKANKLNFAYSFFKGVKMLYAYCTLTVEK